MNTQSPARSGPADAAKIIALLDRLDCEAQAGAAAVARFRRADRRINFRQSALVQVEHPLGGTALLRPHTRNISAGGLSFLHSGSLQCRSKCRVALTDQHGRPQNIAATIARCRPVDPCVHEVGIRFDVKIDPFQFVDIDENNGAAGNRAAARQAEGAGAARAFSLIELVIVVVIIAIIGAIAIPRMSRGAAGASDSSLTGSLAVLRRALDHYSAEHGGTVPTLTNIEAALTTYTDVAGNPSPSKTAVYYFGPYVRKMPPLPVGAKKGSAGIAAADGAGAGWIYNATIGSIAANCTDGETDVRGVSYNTY